MVTRTATIAADASPNRSAAIAFALFAVMLFSLYNATGKWLSADYSPWQILFFRGLFGLVPFAAFALYMRAPTALRSANPGLQVVRGLLGLGANACFIFAYRTMPLADAVAISYAAPVFIVVLSVPLLAERVGPHRGVAALVGFGGVLLIAKPGTGLL